MLEKLQLLLDCDDDELLALLLDIATDDAKSYCGIDDITGIENIIIKMTAELYNKRGNEGVSSISFSGVSENYLTDYSDAIYMALKPHRKIFKVLC